MQFMSAAQAPYVGDFESEAERQTRLCWKRKEGLDCGEGEPGPFTHSGVTDRLKAGDIGGAVSAFTRTVREKYRAAFTEIGSGLAAIVDGFGVISGASINANVAELIIVKTTAQGDVAIPVILVRGADGIWRIDGF